MSDEPVGLTLAKWIAGMGGMVIPAYIDRYCEKRPLLREWQNSGTKDEAVLNGWWDDKPWANVGVLGGRNSFVVFDCDGSEAVHGFRSLCERVGGISWEHVLLYRTPGRKDLDGSGGGLHAMWLWPDWLADFHKAEIREEGWRGGIELRGRGCWTLLPCKRSDGEYEILNAPEKLAEFPRELWLAFSEEAQQQVTGNGTGSGDLKEVSPETAFGSIWTDGRKQAVAGLIWHQLIRMNDDDEEAVLEMALRFAEEQCDPPLDSGVVRRKFEYSAERVRRIREQQRMEMSKWNTSINKLFG